MSDDDDVTVPAPEVELPRPAVDPVGPPDGFTWNPDGEELAKALVARAKAAGQSGGRAPARRTGGSGTGGSGGPGGWRRRRAPGAGWSGPGSDDRDPQAVGSAVDKLIGEHGWGEDLAVHGAVARWDQLVGPEVAAHVQPEHYEDGVLSVRADSTAWATQVRLFAAELVRRFNEEIGDGSVTRVDVRGPQAPSWRRGPRSVPGRGPRDTYG
ncbi:DUF721 domain-containing protein [Jiangella mangrovi]|uniref:Putative nucleic acid-binding Zn ribbon protein n=1 Tax=Jiangella mangrovi TaxID=1524084 RepID=A0A7W9GP56_9ACTN|nr:DciA family protein [Jiangella mangrovi]MBB5787223.1 putative nucleic acid-binding Zn ribbon protein [Jiangella mangrovi]